MKCSTLSTVSSLSFPFPHQKTSEFFLLDSGLHTETPGRVDKSTVLRALEESGQSYDLARETLKHVSVDASGKVELEDWVEVSSPPSDDVTLSHTLADLVCLISQS
jgi:hypothetical protein